MRKIYLALIIFSALLFFSGCGNEKPVVSLDENNSKLNNQAGNLEIRINNFSFSPNFLEINRGDTVTWVNEDSAPHQIVADSSIDLPNPASKVLNKGDSFSFTFSQLGTFHYHCSIHPSMQGTINVK